MKNEFYESPPVRSWPIEHRLRERLRILESGCWVWTGSVNNKGYGLIGAHNPNADRHKNNMVLVHRVAYELWKEPIPKGMKIHHTCRTPVCCNPEHLEAVTQAENVRLMQMANLEETHCYRGHEFTDENTFWVTNPRGGHPYRRCRECKNLRQRVNYKRHNLEVSKQT